MFHCLPNFRLTTTTWLNALDLVVKDQLPMAECVPVCYVIRRHCHLNIEEHILALFTAITRDVMKVIACAIELWFGCAQCMDTAVVSTGLATAEMNSVVCLQVLSAALQLMLQLLRSLLVKT